MIIYLFRILKSSLCVFVILFLLVEGVLADEPTYKQGETIFIETGVEAPDRNPTWYAPMVAKPYAPVFEIWLQKERRGDIISYIPCDA